MPFYVCVVLCIFPVYITMSSSSIPGRFLKKRLNSAFPPIRCLLNTFLENNLACRRAFVSVYVSACVCACSYMLMCLCACLNPNETGRQGVFAVFIVLPMVQSGNYLVGCNC